MSTAEPNWLATARRYVGLAEISGIKHNPVILRWLTSLKAWWAEDETPWCGTFVAATMRESGLPVAKAWYRAKAWLDYGTQLVTPKVGCIVVFDRSGGGHVGFVVGFDEQGRLMVLGGNQGNKVSVAPFTRDRVLGYRWPPGQPLNGGPIPLLASNGAPSSGNEA